MTISLFSKLGLGVLLGAAALAQSPIVCNLKALTPAERQMQTTLGKKLRGAEKRSLPNGVSLTFKAASMTLKEIAEWVEAERKCCPFLDIQITAECEGGAIHLALTGPAGAKELLEGEFGK